VHRQRERGAAAVEFALVVPLLLLLVFGIIEYGVWLADENSVRQGAAAGARMAAAWSVDDSPTPPWGNTPCGTWDAATSPEIQALGCAVVAQTQPLTGQLYVKIRILGPDQITSPTPASAPVPDNWKAPNDVRICLLQVHPSITGFIPLPGKVITARVDMMLEGTSTHGTILLEGQETLPSGLSWSDYCP
jgi:hypothetical protein